MDSAEPYRGLHFPGSWECWQLAAIIESCPRDGSSVKEHCLTWAHIIQWLVRDLKARPLALIWDHNAAQLQLQSKPWAGGGLGHENITAQCLPLMAPLFSPSQESLSEMTTSQGAWSIRNGPKHDLNIRLWSWIIHQPVNIGSSNT